MKTDTLSSLYQTILTLRSEKGCPWDKKQTPQSLIKYIRAETEELIEAIKKEDISNSCEELGDVLYLILMLSIIHNERQDFSINNVAEEVNQKLIRRHPHVFAGTTYENEEELAQQWEKIKQQEKRAKTQ